METEFKKILVQILGVKNRKGSQIINNRKYEQASKVAEGQKQKRDSREKGSNTNENFPNYIKGATSIVTFLQALR